MFSFRPLIQEEHVALIFLVTYRKGIYRKLKFVRLLSTAYMSLYLEVHKFLREGGCVYCS